MIDTTAVWATIRILLLAGFFKTIELITTCLNNVWSLWRTVNLKIELNFVHSEHTLISIIMLTWPSKFADHQLSGEAQWHKALLPYWRGFAHLQIILNNRHSHKSPIFPQNLISFLKHKCHTFTGIRGCHSITTSKFELLACAQLSQILTVNFIRWLSLSHRVAPRIPLNCALAGHTLCRAVNPWGACTAVIRNQHPREWARSVLLPSRRGEKIWWLLCKTTTLKRSLQKLVMFDEPRQWLPPY